MNEKYQKPQLKKDFYRLLFFILLLLFSDVSVVKAASLQVPRFVSLRSERVNARVGPGLRYPIEWVFVRPQLPVKVVREFGHWRLIRDVEGAEGWVHQRMLSGLRTISIQNNGLSRLFSRPSENASIVAKLETGVICQLVQIKKDWVKVKVASHTGWLRRDQIWGVLDNE